MQSVSDEGEDVVISQWKNGRIVLKKAWIQKNKVESQSLYAFTVGVVCIILSVLGMFKGVSGAHR